MRTLSVEQLAQRLSDRFGLLVGGARTALERQRTLRASVDWSHGLLDAGEQRALRRVAVFMGGFSLEAAEQVCDATVAELEALVDQSLVLAEPHGRDMRYRLLETVREYGLERLAKAGEEDTLRGRHRDWFAALALEAGPHLESPRQPLWLRRLRPEAANLAAALDHALRTDPSAALEMCAVLYPFWRTRGQFRRGGACADACARGRRRRSARPAGAGAHHAGDPVDGAG